MMPQTDHIKRYFNKAHKTYDANCALQQQTGDALIELTKPYLHAANSIIDLGCGSGIVTEKMVTAASHQHFHAIDIADELLQLAKDRLTSRGVAVYVADFNQLPPQQIIFDLAFSNLALHWSADLSATLQQLKQNMRQDGLVVFSIPLVGTLTELKFQYALQHFLTSAQVKEKLLEKNYEVLTLHSEKIHLHFDTLLAALQSIKEVGANFVGKRMHKGLRGKSSLNLHLAQQLTYVIGYFVARNKG